MFTGIVQQIGRVTHSTPQARARKLQITGRFAALELGESIAVDGVCLTVTRVTADGFEADVSAETLARTTLGSLHVGQKVNLERALRPIDRLGGHLVSGHVDTVATLVRRAPLGEAIELWFEFDRSLSRYVAEKGSITLSGVSLTVNQVSPLGAEKAQLQVVIIPHTQGATTLADQQPGSAVNLEVDLIARYVARLLGKADDHAGRSSDQQLAALLAQHGFGSPSL